MEKQLRNEWIAVALMLVFVATSLILAQGKSMNAQVVLEQAKQLENKNEQLITAYLEASYYYELSDAYAGYSDFKGVTMRTERNLKEYMGWDEEEYELMKRAYPIIQQGLNEIKQIENDYLAEQRYEELESINNNYQTYDYYNYEPSVELDDFDVPNVPEMDIPEVPDYSVDMPSMNSQSYLRGSIDIPSF